MKIICSNETNLIYPCYREDPEAQQSTDPDPRPCQHHPRSLETEYADAQIVQARHTAGVRIQPASKKKHRRTGAYIFRREQMASWLLGKY